MPTPQQVKAKEKAKAKALQAKADAKTANKAAAKPKTVSSNVKVTKPGTMAENQLRNASSTFKTANTGSGSTAKFDAMKVDAANKVAKANGQKPKVVSVRSTPGISGTGGAKVSAIYKPMGGSGMGLLSIKNR